MRRSVVLQVAAACLGGATLAAPLVACAADARPDGPLVEGAWARPTPTVAADGVLYLTIVSDVDDELVGVEVPASVATSVELHETVAVGGGAHAHGGSGAESLAMGSVDAIELPAGEAVELAPGGNHAMLVGLAEPLERGETFEVTVHLSSGRTLATTADVATNRPSG